MQYVLLIYDNEQNWNVMSPDEIAAMEREFREFTAEIKNTDQFRGAQRLEPVATATTVRIRNGKVQTTDGPYAETREQLGGLYVVEAANLDDALQLATRVPSARTGSIEVRPLWPMTQSA